MPLLQDWLDDTDTIRGIFVIAKVFNVTTQLENTIYLSSVGYVSTDNVVFEPIIRQSLRTQEVLSIDGTGGISYGDIELDNVDGALDQWLDPAKYIWVNRFIEVYVGSPLWESSTAAFPTNFHLVFSGVIEDIDSRDIAVLNLKVRDKLFLLNTPINEDKVGAGNPNPDTLKPVAFGEIFNAEPVLVDPAQLEFMLHRSTVERILEIRDNGVPIYIDTGLTGANTSGATLNLAAGTFRLTTQPAGTITVSFQGDKNSINLTTGALTSTYTNKINNIIAVLVSQYGNVKLSATTELDLPNMATFGDQTAGVQPVGFYTSDSTTVLEACNMLAASIGGQVYINSLGKLRLLRVGVPTSDASVTITEDDIILDSLSISNKLPMLASTKIGYAKNYFVQTGLVTSIPEEHKDSYAREWLSVTNTDTAIKTEYRLTGEPAQKDTLLIAASDAATEAERLTTFYKSPKIVYRFVGTSRLIDLKLGQAVTLVHSRFNLYNSGAGKSGQVVSISPDWLNSTVELEVLI